MGYPPVRNYGDSYIHLHVSRRGHALWYRLTMSYSLIQGLLLLTPTRANSYDVPYNSGPVFYRVHVSFLHTRCTKCDEIGMVRVLLIRAKVPVATLSCPLCLLLEDKYGVRPSSRVTNQFEVCDYEKSGYRYRFELELVNG